LEAAHEADLEPHLSSRAGSDDGVAFAQGKGHRLFEKNMLARLGCGDSQGGMGEGRSSDYYRLKATLVKGVIELGKAVWDAKVAGYSLPCFGVSIDHRHY